MKCRIEVHSEAGRLFARLALSIARGIARFYGLRVGCGTRERQAPRCSSRSGRSGKRPGQSCTP